jgi:uncharacterized membrane protein
MTVLVILIIVTVAVFIAMKTGKVKDENNNNIPDVIEKPIEAVKEAVAEVKEIVEKATKTPAVKKPTTQAAKPKSKK